MKRTKPNKSNKHTPHPCLDYWVEERHIFQRRLFFFVLIPSVTVFAFWEPWYTALICYTVPEWQCSQTSSWALLEHTGCGRAACGLILHFWRHFLFRIHLFSQSFPVFNQTPYFFILCSYGIQSRWLTQRSNPLKTHPPPNHLFIYNFSDISSFRICLQDFPAIRQTSSFLFGINSDSHGTEFQELGLQCKH